MGFPKGKHRNKIPSRWPWVRSRLRRGLASRDLSLRVIAGVVGCNHNAVAKWLREEYPTMPSADKVRALDGWLSSKRR